MTQTLLVLQEEYTWHDHSIWKPLLDKYAYVSFEHPEHFRDSKSEQGGAQEGPATISQPVSDENRGYDDDDKYDGSSEGDVDEIYEETGNIPMSLWTEVLLAESIRNDLINCVPAVVSHLFVARVLGGANYLTNVNVFDGILYARSCSHVRMCACVRPSSSPHCFRCTHVGMKLTLDG